MEHETQHRQQNGKSSRIIHWRCPNCGQIFFTMSEDELPATCGICHQAIAWERLGNTVNRWRCPNCGQTLFTAPDDSPPDMCDYCHDMTTWEKV